MFAFLCGSLARKELNEKSDFDMFVCVKRYDEKAYVKFREWYFDVHSKRGYTADKEFPGEVMEIDKLQKCLNICYLEQPKFHIKNPILYDGIVWAGMLSGVYTAFQGDFEMFSKLRASALEIMVKWAGALTKNSNPPDYDIILKRLVKYSPNNE